MSDTSPSPSAVAACVLQACRSGATHAAIATKLIAIGVRPHDVTNAIELVRDGIARAALIQSGLAATRATALVLLLALPPARN